MSYKCGNCGVQQPPRTPQHPIVVQTRKSVIISGDVEIPTSQIVKEIKVCPACKVKLEPKPPLVDVIKPSDIRKAERATRKRSELFDDTDID